VERACRRDTDAQRTVSAPRGILLCREARPVALPHGSLCRCGSNCVGVSGVGVVAIVLVLISGIDVVAIMLV
jgi:hypothetical protein